MFNGISCAGNIPTNIKLLAFEILIDDDDDTGVGSIYKASTNSNQRKRKSRRAELLKTKRLRILALLKKTISLRSFHVTQTVNIVRLVGLSPT